MILPGGRAARAGQYLLQLRLDLQLQLQRRAGNKAARPSRKGSSLAAGLPPPSPSQPAVSPLQAPPPKEAVRARHLISTSTIVVLHYTGSNILNGATQSDFSASHQDQERETRNRKVVEFCAYSRLCPYTCMHMRLYARTYEAARTYKYTLAKSIPSVAKVVRYPPW